MLDLILKLIDRCIDLLNRREEANRRLFEDFIDPAFSAFETLHNDYLERFLKYRQIIIASDEPIDDGHHLFDLMKLDNLLSASHRAKIWELENYVTDPVYGTFILAIIRYIRLDPNWEPNPTKERTELSVFAQTIARTTRQRIKDTVQATSSDQSQRKEAVEVIDKTIRAIQEGYAVVVQERSRLKNKLLKPK